MLEWTLILTATYLPGKLPLSMQRVTEQAGSARPFCMLQEDSALHTRAPQSKPQERMEQGKTVRLANRCVERRGIQPPKMEAHQQCCLAVGPQTHKSETRSFGACWAEARIKIARMTLTIKLDGNWSSFQLANSAPPLRVTGSATAPSARMGACVVCFYKVHPLR